MVEAIQEIESALAALGKLSPWGPDIKASDDFLDPLFRKFYEKLGLPNLMRKTDYHALAPFVPAAALDNEIRETLDLIAQTADQAKPRRDNCRISRSTAIRSAGLRALNGTISYMPALFGVMLAGWLLGGCWVKQADFTISSKAFQSPPGVCASSRR